MTGFPLALLWPLLGVQAPPATPVPTAAVVTAAEMETTRINGFFVGSISYNSGLQIVPEAFGGTPAVADPGRVNARFDAFGLGIARSFTPWLSVSAAVEVESHRDRHSHVVPVTETANRRGCPPGHACERFGAEAPAIDVTLDRFQVALRVPVGNGLQLALGRFDVPFGIERHDPNLNLTATTSELFRFARPQRMTGLQASYVFGPSADLSAWVVNRWEAEDTGEGDFNDVNAAKGVGGRLGLTPIYQEGLLSFGLGGWASKEGPEQGTSRWVLDLDATWSPHPSLILAAEWVRGGQSVSGLRAVGDPVSEPPLPHRDARWWGLFLLGHHDFTEAAGLTLRYSALDDADRARTGVSQTLRSFTVAPVLHLSALAAGLRPLATPVPRSRHPYHWVDLKLEYRFNHSSRRAFGEAQPNVSLHDQASQSSHQVQLQLAVNF